MADRSYSSSFNQNKAAPIFNYVEDATLNSGSGAWRPLRTTDLNTNVIVSGIDSIIVDTDEMEGLARTGNALIQSGNNYSAPCSLTCSSGFTGSLLAKSSAGEIHTIFGYCSGNTQYLRVYDGTGSNGTLIGMIVVAAQNNFFVDYSAHGARTTAGIFVAFSSSPSSQVDAGNNGIITITWK